MCGGTGNLGEGNYANVSKMALKMKLRLGS